MSNKVVSVAIGLLFFFGAKYGVEYWLNQNRYSEAQEGARDAFNELKEVASNRQEGEFEAEAIQRAATEKINELIQNEGTLLEKKKIASSTFMGFYLVNSRERRKFCDQFKIDISSFTTKFEDLHKAEHELASRYLFTKSFSPEDLYKLINEQLEEAVKIDMRDIANAYANGSLSEACILFQDQGDVLAENIHLAKMQPKIYETLHAVE